MLHAGCLVADAHVGLAEDGRLCVRFLESTLRYESVAAVIDRLLAAGTSRQRRFVFDFSGVETIASPWTAVFALLLMFARRTADCALAGLGPQPGAMAAVALRGVSRRLLRVEEIEHRDAA